ncbi:MAG: peptide chain release factor N(5)-glutamine methyltransferase, partial [Clostridia bacterium]|nr:peptide chain release factor N(5)-glutamine methyltransferase [Clostridia bacterium]
MTKIAEDKISFSEAYVTAKEKLENKNKYEQSDLDFIFCEVLNRNRAEIKLVKEISKTDYKKILKAVERRANGEPVTKIFGRANFYGLNFIVNKNVLSPRMDTEILVEQVIKNCNKNFKVLDVGTGSGAIAITIAKETGACVTALDISEEALKVAKQNAKLNGVSVIFKKSNLFNNISKLSKFDIIVSNPPYIPSQDIPQLDDEVKKHDPIIALDGGVSGLDFYEKIINEAPKKLKSNGKIFFEVGIYQAKDVKKLLQKNFKDIR